MTQSFDEWWKEFSGDKYLPENQFIGIAYKAGAASRQAEIDKLKADHHGAEIGRDCFIKQLKDRHKSEVYELKTELEALQGMHNATSLYAGELVDERDELKKRIDEVIYDLQHIESAMWEEQVEHVLMVLKGDQS